MKHSTAILYVLVTLSLAFSVAAFALVADNSGIFMPSSPPNTPPPSVIFTPTEAPSRSNVSISYRETSRQNISDTTTRVTISLNAQLINSSGALIDYYDFYIEPTVFRTVPLPKGAIHPIGYGTFTLGPFHIREEFGLMFEFPTMSDDGSGYTPTFYTLKYNGTASIIWLNPGYH